MRNIKYTWGAGTGRVSAVSGRPTHSQKMLKTNKQKKQHGSQRIQQWLVEQEPPVRLLDQWEANSNSNLDDEETPNP